MIFAEAWVEAIPKEWEWVNEFLLKFWLRGDSYAKIFMEENQSLFLDDGWLIIWKRYKLPLQVYRIRKWDNLSDKLKEAGLGYFYIDKIFEYNKKFNPDFKNINSKETLYVDKRVLMPEWETWFYVDYERLDGSIIISQISKLPIIFPDGTKTHTLEIKEDNSNNQTTEDIKDIQNNQAPEDDESEVISIFSTEADILFYNEWISYNILFNKIAENQLSVTIWDKSYNIPASSVSEYLDVLWDVLDEHFWEDRNYIWQIARDIYEKFFPDLLKEQNNRKELEDILYRRNFTLRIKPFLKYSKSEWYEYPIIKDLKDTENYIKDWYIKRYQLLDFEGMFVKLNGIWQVEWVNPDYLCFTPMAYDIMWVIWRKIHDSTWVIAEIVSWFRPKVHNDEIKDSRGVRISSKLSPHQWGNAFDIGFKWLNWKNREIVFDILKKLDIEWKIILTRESNHFHVTVTNPEIRKKYDQHVIDTKKTRRRRIHALKMKNFLKKEQILAKISPDNLLEWEDDRDKFRLWEYLKENGLPHSTRKLLKELMKRYMGIDSSDFSRKEDVYSYRMEIMIRFLLSIESGWWNLNAQHSKSSAKWAFQYLDWYKANLDRVEDENWDPYYNRSNRFSSFDNALRRAAIHFTWYQRWDGNIDWWDNRIPEYIWYAYRYPWVISPTDLSAEQMMNLWLVDIFMKDGTDKALNELLLNWKVSSLKKLYWFHHTNVDGSEKTADVVDLKYSIYKNEWIKSWKFK